MSSGTDARACDSHGDGNRSGRRRHHDAVHVLLRLRAAFIESVPSRFLWTSDPTPFTSIPKNCEHCLKRLARGADGRLVTPRGNRVRAVIPVHLFGACCAMDALCEAVVPYRLADHRRCGPGRRSGISRGMAARRGRERSARPRSSAFSRQRISAGQATAASRSAGVGNSPRSCVLLRNHGMEGRYFHRTRRRKLSPRRDPGGRPSRQASVRGRVERRTTSKRSALSRGFSQTCPICIKLPSEPWKRHRRTQSSHLASIRHPRPAPRRIASPSGTGANRTRRLLSRSAAPAGVLFLPWP